MLILARDPEIDRLKSIQDSCFERKQKAYNKQSELWNEVSKLSTRIEYTKQRQQRLYGQMKDCFERASAAHNSKDFSNAKLNASQGHDYQYQNQQAVSELRGLIAEVKVLRDAQKRALEEFRSTKESFDRASKDFQTRLEIVKAKNQRDRDERKDIARRAGVPNHYIDNVWVKKSTDGITHIFFGGAGKPDGPGHGHYTVDINGKVSYDRDPWEQHGSQNFNHDVDLERKLTTIALNAYQQFKDRSSVGPQTTQFNDGNVVVRVKSGYRRDGDTIVTDLIIRDNINSPGEHLHLILSEYDGRILHSKWTKNHS